MNKPRKFLMPQWDGVFEGWSRKWVRRNFWRVRVYFMDPEDAVQECALIFSRCLATYRDSRVSNLRWFMALYKVSVSNAWNSYAKRDSRIRELGIGQPLDDLPAHLHPGEEGLARLVASLSGASQELQRVLSLMANAPAEMLEVMFPERRGMTEEEEFQACERRLAGLAGVRGAKVLTELRELLQ